MTAGPAIIAIAFGAWIAWRMGEISRAERSDVQAMMAVASLCGPIHRPIRREPIHPDQDATGDMPEKSPVRTSIEDAQTRANHFGGDSRLRYPSRWKARFVEPRPEPVKRDWA